MKTIRGIIFGLLFALVVVTVAPLPAHAQMRQTCAPGILNQSDMAGGYIGIDRPFRMVIATCGRTDLYWTDPYGVEQWASYSATERVPGGGYMATVGSPLFPGMLGPWNTRTMLYKPAERGQIQVLLWLVWQQDLVVLNARKLF